MARDRRRALKPAGPLADVPDAAPVMESPRHMEALALDPATRRRFTRHRVDWPASLILEGGIALEGVTRDYCVGGAFVALEARAHARTLPGNGTRGRLRLAPRGIAPAEFTVEVRQSGSEGIGLMFLHAAEADTARLLSEATRPPASTAAPKPEAGVLRATLRSMLERNIKHWGPLWLAALRQRLFRVAAEAPSSQQHRLMDVHQALERGADETLALMIQQVLRRFDDPADRSGESLTLAPDGATDDQPLSLVDNDAFEDFLAEADLASRVEAVHRNLLYRVNAMLVAALGDAFETGEGPLSPRALVRGLWLAVQGRTSEVAVRQLAQALFNEMFVSRFGEFYSDCARRLVEAGFEAEAEMRPIAKPRSAAGPQTQVPPGPAPAAQSPTGEAQAASAPTPAQSTGPFPAQSSGPFPAPLHPAGDPFAAVRLFAATDPFASLAAGHAAALGAEAWPAVHPDMDIPERTFGQPGLTAPGRGVAASAGVLPIGQAQAEALARFYARVGSAGSRATMRIPGRVSGPAVPGHVRGANTALRVHHALPGQAHPTFAPPFHAGPMFPDEHGDGRAAMADLPFPGHPTALEATLCDTDAPLVPYARLPRPAEEVAGVFVDDFLAGLSADPRVGEPQRMALESLRAAVEGAVAHSPAALTDPTHPVRRVASALSRLVWVDGEQAVAPCGLGVGELLDRLAQPAGASHAMFLEVARELEATLVTQRAAVARASASLVDRHAEQLAIVQSRRRPEEVHGILAEQMPEALVPWVNRARALQVGDEVLQRRPKQADLLLRLVWVGDGQRQFAFTDPAAVRLHGMTLQELALQLMRGRIVPAQTDEEPVAQALLTMVDAADARLQSAVAVHQDSGLLSEVGVLAALDGLVPARSGDGQPVDAQLARWRARGDAPASRDGLLEVLRAGLPAGTRFAELDDGDLLAFAPPGLSEHAAWVAAVRAVGDHLGARPALPASMAAVRRFRPAEEQPQAVLTRLALALGGGDPDLFLAPGSEELRAALHGRGPYSIVSDVTPLRASDEVLTPATALALLPRLLEGVVVDTAVVNADTTLAADWDRWMLDEAIGRALAEGDDPHTRWYVPVSDLALGDQTFVAHVGDRLLDSGISPSRLMIELGLTREDQHEALLNVVAGLQAFGCGVALRYRHGMGLTAALLRRAGVGCLHLPDWLSESDQLTPERSLLIQSLVDLCRFIDIPALAIVHPGQVTSADLRALGVDWLQESDARADGTVRLARRDGAASAS